ncbi:hypothetical protein K474DRAFT_1674634 [Panus rudis PR-1116 ss-1]|nr:hypothetical protein K474DRAFT_1674634 [Panus rudis PR-1116 ss-1]
MAKKSASQGVFPLHFFFLLPFFPPDPLVFFLFYILLLTHAPFGPVDHQKHPSMSPPHPHTVGVAANNHFQDDDDDDDICPVCESECTCRNRPSSSTLPPPPEPSLKIKLSLPPHLKSRRILASPASASANPPRRRGRPSKADIAARQAALAAAPAPPKPKAGTKKPRLAGTFVSTHATSSKVVVSSSAHDQDETDSDDELPPGNYPTFVSADAISSHTESSDSDESITSVDSDSMVEDDDGELLSHSLIRRKFNKKQKLDLSGDDASSARRRSQGSRREPKTRTKSTEPESDDSSSDDDDDGGADDEDDDDEDEEETAEADVEGEGLAEFDDDEEDEEQPQRPLDGKLGVSFGWDEEDEESSFDAELFFANLEDSSDSDTPQNVFENNSFASEEEESGTECGSRSFDADERDALLLMDVDPSAHVRRGNGELEFGVALHGLSFGLDGFMMSRQHDNLTSFGFTTDEDFDMTASSDGESTSSFSSNTAEEALPQHHEQEIVLEETDGETTEDELVDADGLPNSRAMMLFKWPTTVSTINPLSTVSSKPSPTSTSPPSTTLSPPPNAPQSVRIALASYSSTRSTSASSSRTSPPPTPADILAGKLSNGDLDEIEMKQQVDDGENVTSRGGAVMGHFVAPPQGMGAFAVVDGSCKETGTPFPRVRIVRKAPVASEVESPTKGSSSLLPPFTPTPTPPPSSHSSRSSLTPYPPSSQTSEDFSSADPEGDTGMEMDIFDLDDVLEPSFLSLDPSSPDHLSTPTHSHSHTHTLHTTEDLWSTPGTDSMSLMSRWDRIPVNTFRRTRTVGAPAVTEYPGSDTSVGGGFASAPVTHPHPSEVGSVMKARGKDKKHKGKKSYTNKMVISPVLLPVLRERDGESLLPLASGSGSGSGQQQQQQQQQKTRKERKRKAMGSKHAFSSSSSMSRKLHHTHNNHTHNHHRHHHHHHHHPNTKYRGSNSVQRSGFFTTASGVPPF